MGVLGATFKRKHKDIKGEIIYLPFSAQNAMPGIGKTWALLEDSDVRKIISNTQDWPGDPLTENWITDQLESVNRAMANESLIDLAPLLDSPNSDISMGDIGLSASWESILFSTNIYGGWLKDRKRSIHLSPKISQYLEEERLPTLMEQQDVLDAIENPLKIVQPRFWTMGGDLSSLLGPFGVRMELAYRSKQGLQDKYFQTQISSWYGTGLAIDWTNGSSLFASIEGNYQRYPQATSSWLELTESSTIAGNLAGNALGMRLNWAIRGIMIFPVEDSLISTQIGWRINKRWAVQTNLLVLTGEPKEIPYIYEGSIIGYWEQNDSLNLTLQWTP
jgi:hypothetical protein